MNITIDKQACVGCGWCSDACPAVFRMAGGKAIVARNPITDSTQKRCLRAIELCPQMAISDATPHAFMMRTA
jgi:ferredoxin